jgi:tetratricopeptide (TPR) repeat protein
LLVDYGAAHSRDVLPKARAHAQAAVELDDSLAEAHASLGAISQHEYDWSTAERRLKRAIELRPGYATAHQWYAEVLLARGRFGEGIAAAERARQLDPTAPVVNYIVAIAFFVSRDYQRAIDQAKKTLDLDPDFTFARAYLVLAYLGSARLADASVALDEARNGSSVLETLRVQVLARRGERAAAKKLLADVERRFASSPFPRIGVAGAHLALGEDEAAFAWLERAVEAREPSVPIGRWSPLWDPVRADPRFRELNRRMNLE